MEDQLSASTVDLKVMFWVTTEDYRKGALMTRGNVMRAVKEGLDKAGIYLPCEVRELKTYGPAEKIVVEMTGIQTPPATPEEEAASLVKDAPETSKSV